MPELEEMWTNAMDEAKKRAAEMGRGDVLDYLRLREANDAARRIGIEWLMNTFLDVAAEANRRGLSLTIEKSDDSHRFAIGTTTMQGLKIQIKSGIRSMTVEAGFPRIPQDGFIRGGGLAAAKISHFGMTKENADLLLVRANTNEKDAPFWVALDENNLRQPFSTAHLKHHFAVFLGHI